MLGFTFYTFTQLARMRWGISFSISFGWWKNLAARRLYFKNDRSGIFLLNSSNYLDLGYPHMKTGHKQCFITRAHSSTNQSWWVIQVQTLLFLGSFSAKDKNDHSPKNIGWAILPQQDSNHSLGYFSETFASPGIQWPTLWTFLVKKSNLRSSLWVLPKISEKKKQVACNTGHGSWWHLEAYFMAAAET